MSDEWRSFAGNIKKTLFHGLGTLTDDELKDKIEALIGRDALNRLLSKAGQGKNEIIQLLGKEIGTALAAVLTEPLQRVVNSKEIHITIQLRDKKPQEPKASEQKKRKK